MTPAQMAALHGAAFTTPRPWSEAEFAGLLSLPDTFAVTDDSGFALGRVTLDEAELLTIAVSPDAQGQGVGRAILGRFHDAASARGASLVFLDVAADNAPAIALYTRAGYGESGRRPRYYTRPDGCKVDAVLMSRAVGPA